MRSDLTLQHELFNIARQVHHWSWSWSDDLTYITSRFCPRLGVCTALGFILSTLLIVFLAWSYGAITSIDHSNIFVDNNLRQSLLSSMLCETLK
jgi:hypothetical protein